MKAVKLHQYKALHSNENDQQSNRDIHKMKEDTCKQDIGN